MMWHYGIVGERTIHGDLYFSIREIYNFEDGDIATTVDPIPATGEIPEEILQNLNWMYKDAQHYPVYMLDEEGNLEEYTGP